MASSKLLLNLSASFLCSCRVSSSPSSRHLLSLYTLPPITKSQPSLRFCTSAAATTAVDSAPAALSDHEEATLDVGHPWPEWDSFVDKLRSKGYFERAPATTDGNLVPTCFRTGIHFYYRPQYVQLDHLTDTKRRNDYYATHQYVYYVFMPEEEGEGEGKNATMDTNKLKNACLKFARDRYDILRLGVCKLRGSCDKAYVAPKDEQARTVDMIRVLLMYALEPNNLSGGEHFVQTNVQESARSLLSELIRLSDTTIDPSLPKPALHKVSSKKEDVRESRSKASSRSRQSVGVEMKKGDWLCPKCNFLNFARNMRCFECNETGPKVAGASEIQMKPGDWTCPKCEFMNFARNRACFRCEEPHKRELNFGEWECPSCNYVNFKRNQECRRCNCERPQGTGNQLQDRLWEKPKQSFRESNFKFGDDSYGTEEEEHGVMSTFDGYRNIGWRNREKKAE